VSGHPPERADLLVVGAGAAGLAAAIFCARDAPGARIVVVDGARRIGAKILVSGGGRCNVTNVAVSEHDFWGGPPHIVRHVLRAFPPERAVAFFEQLGVPLHQEENGKLFPDSNRARSVLDALLAEAAACGVTVHTEVRVGTVTRDAGGFQIESSGVTQRAHAVVLATGGLSLPKTGSDGAGHAMATTLGHRLVATTPALVPLLLEGDHHASLSGVSHQAEVAVRVEGKIVRRLEGSLLWTHFGASGPVILDASRHWHRAVLELRPIELTLNCCPGEMFATFDEWLLQQRRLRPKALVTTVLSERLPGAVAAALSRSAGVAINVTLAHLGKEMRRAIVRAVVEQPLRVRGSRGYNYAEATAGGVRLDEVDPGSMESRVCRGLYLVGEMLDVDGRLGGFNFQWAWSSGYVAGSAIARRLRSGEM
jgi:predicted Rossmann fold flavoprotein